MADIDSGTSASHSRDRTRHRMVLKKGEHSWQLRWDSGDEEMLVSTVSDMAADDQVDFDWFDAAMVRHQIANTLPPTPDTPE